MVEADQRFWHPFTAFRMAEEMVSHLLCQVDEAGCILVKQNEIVQESPKKGYGPKGGCHLSVSLPGYVNHPWRGLSLYYLIELCYFTAIK